MAQQTDAEEIVAWEKDCTSTMYAVSNDVTRSQARMKAKEMFRDEHGDGFVDSKVTGENEGTGIYYVITYRF